MPLQNLMIKKYHNQVDNQKVQIFKYKIKLENYKKIKHYVYP